MYEVLSRHRVPGGNKVTVTLAVPDSPSALASLRDAEARKLATDQASGVLSRPGFDKFGDSGYIPEGSDEPLTETEMLTPGRVVAGKGRRTQDYVISGALEASAMLALHGLASRPQAALAWQAPETFATTLALLAYDEWGTEWLSWLPETVRREVDEAWGVTISEPTFARLMAARLVLASDAFYKARPAFVACCAAFSGGVPSAELAEPLDALECAWGITEALGLDPEARDPDPFSDEIRRYIGVVCAHEGIHAPPDVLRVAIMPPKPRHPSPREPELIQASREVNRIRSGEIVEALRSGLARLEAQRLALGLSDAESRPPAPPIDTEGS